jgi:hypothetical protein
LLFALSSRAFFMAHVLHGAHTTRPGLDRRRIAAKRADFARTIPFAE